MSSNYQNRKGLFESRTTDCTDFTDDLAFSNNAVNMQKPYQSVESVQSVVSRTSLLFVAGGLLTACFLGAVACLWQWGGPVGWARIDRFSGSALLLSGLFVVQHVHFCRKLPASRDVMQEAFGANYDPLMGLFNSLLLVGELVVFCDYGHWRLTPWLERASLQCAGLGIYLLALLLVIWADQYLIRHFATEKSAQQVITTGPYRYVRHPRYTGLFITRLAFALTFASVFAWVSMGAWFLVVRRRIRIEERYLRDIFGDQYEHYALWTARLVPGIF
jgi:protein-S-isoprenylcysteine O-methyltransferase Ste14